MEQQLKDAINNGTWDDEIASEMIKARLATAGRKLDNVCHTFANALEQMYKEYCDELGLLGSTVIFYYKDRLFELERPGDDQFEIAMIDGYGKFIEQFRDDLNKLETRK